MLEKQTWTWLLFIGLAAFGLMILTGNSLINWLRALPNMKWSAREDTPDTHLKKAGTPSMGGLGIIGAAIGAVWGFGWIYTVMSLRGSANAIVPAAVRNAVIVEQIESTIFLAIIAGFMWLGFVDGSRNNFSNPGFPGSRGIGCNTAGIPWDLLNDVSPEGRPGYHIFSKRDAGLFFPKMKGP